MSRELYKVTFQGAYSEDHDSIFMQSESDGSGFLLHVVDGAIIDGWVNARYQNKPFNRIKCTSIKRLLKVGSVAESKVSELLRVCRSTTPPARPVAVVDPEPDSKVWVHNVLYELNVRQVLAAEDGVDIPHYRASYRFNLEASSSRRVR